MKSVSNIITMKHQQSNNLSSFSLTNIIRSLMDIVLSLSFQINELIMDLKRDDNDKIINANNKLNNILTSFNSIEKQLNDYDKNYEDVVENDGLFPTFNFKIFKDVLNFDSPFKFLTLEKVELGSFEQKMVTAQCFLPETINQKNINFYIFFPRYFQEDNFLILDNFLYFKKNRFVFKITILNNSSEYKTIYKNQQIGSFLIKTLKNE